jgi:hypothetical protein
MTPDKTRSVSSIPAVASPKHRDGSPKTPHRRGGENRPSTSADLIRDPELRAAFLRAYRAWEKAQ